MKDWQIKAIELYKRGYHAGEISMLLMVDYHTAYGFLRKYADYKPPLKNPNNLLRHFSFSDKVHYWNKRDGLVEV